MAAGYSSYVNNVGTVMKSHSISFSLTFMTEPVGSKAPAFANDLRTSGFDRQTGQGFALLCQAQAFPVPMFR